MKKVKRRAGSAMLLALLLIAGLGLFMVRLWQDGGNWVMLRANVNIYNNGVLDTGTLTDRNGVVLAHAGNGAYSYAGDALTRKSCFHVVGDYAGNIGTGAVTVFASRLAGYSRINGVCDPNGETVKLSIDSELNNIAFNALAGRNGAVILMDYTTGEILCMVSAPGLDPGASDNNIADGAFLNRCISSVYTPGSVFKLVTLAAALEEIPDLESRSFQCSGGVTVGGDWVACTGVHGSQTIEQALANSCNCAFAEISLELGSEKIIKYAEALGFLSQHEINGISTAKGSIEEAKSGSSDLAWSGIGQYTDLVSPFSMLRYTAAIANGGLSVEATILPGEGGTETRLLKENTARKIANMMSYTVTYAYGESKFPGLSVAAKTGTAETGTSSHAWFTGFLNDADHPYAFVVVVENGGGGLANAAPIANAVLQEAVKAD